MNVHDRFDGAAVWADLPAEQQSRIGAIALELLAAWYAQEMGRAELLDDETPLSRAGGAADFLLINELRELLVEAVPRAALEIDGQPRLPSMLGSVCRVCGCSHRDACGFGCYWIADDLCSACAGTEAHNDPINLAGSGPVPIEPREG